MNTMCACRSHVELRAALQSEEQKDAGWVRMVLRSHGLLPEKAVLFSEAESVALFGMAA